MGGAGWECGCWGARGTVRVAVCVGWVAGASGGARQGDFSCWLCPQGSTGLEHCCGLRLRTALGHPYYYAASHSLQTELASRLPCLLLLFPLLQVDHLEQHLPDVLGAGAQLQPRARPVLGCAPRNWAGASGGTRVAATKDSQACARSGGTTAHASLHANPSMAAPTPPHAGQADLVTAPTPPSLTPPCGRTGTSCCCGAQWRQSRCR